ncbi:MAG: SUMF1/EgtB/PvdO family nonheme iron enzyme, partial [Candidatus Poseidoniia archaeon]|nr:SUMF1/EgtB/PvdO family nonheme iron enzyme [Candidatus Poseidoniia archaeon]
MIFSVSVGKTESNSEVESLLQDCENCPLMVMIPPGSFVMGAPISDSGSRNDERPQHQVNIAYTFAVGKFEVTRGEY